MVIQAIAAGALIVDCESGTARSIRWPHALGTINRAGYVVFTLHFGGERRQLKAHRVVWIAANGPIPDELVPDHINRNKSDNRVVNLRLASAALNAQNRRRYDGDGNPAAKITMNTAGEIRLHHKTSKSYAKTAAHFGVSKSLAAQIVRGEIWGKESA